MDRVCPRLLEVPDAVDCGEDNFSLNLEEVIIVLTWFREQPRDDGATFPAITYKAPFQVKDCRMLLKIPMEEQAVALTHRMRNPKMVKIGKLTKNRGQIIS